MKYPDIFIVGFQKCGSSSLANLLSQHPEIELSNPKETFCLVDNDYEHYDYDNSVDNKNHNWSAYYPTQSENKLWIEASVCNFYQNNAIKHIQKNKNSKVIFILRDPVDRLWSTYQYYGKNDLRLSGNLTFNKYIRLIEEGNYNKEGMKYALEHCYYGKYIDKWIEVLGEEKVMIVGLRPLIQDTKNQILKIYNFMGVDNFEHQPSMPRKNVSKEFRWPYMSRIIHNIIGGKGIGNLPIVSTLIKWGKTESKDKVSDSIRKEYMKKFENEYKRFSEYF